MSLSSWEEDAIFKAYGWYKNLVKRQYEGPTGATIDFDEVMQITANPQGEIELRRIIVRFGTREP